MHVLIVESNVELALLWQQHIERAGCAVSVAPTQYIATEMLRKQRFAVVILAQIPEDGGAFAVADYASFRHPDVALIFVSDAALYSDGSVFQHIPNVRAHLQPNMPAADLSEIVRHYALGR